MPSMLHAGACWSGTLTTTFTTTVACGVDNSQSLIGNGANLTINHNITNNVGGGTGRKGDTLDIRGGGTITINNNATIYSQSQFGINLESAGVTINNGVNGVIDSDGFRAIQYGGGASSGTIDNLGTIGTSATPVGILSQGASLTLNNSQGGDNGLQFTGNLPENYNIIINSTTDYGKLISYSNNWYQITGTMNVDIDSRSSVSAGTYQDVFSARIATARDFASSNFDSLTGTFGTLNWELTSRTVSDIVYWDITFTNSRTSYTSRVTTSSLAAAAKVLESINTRGARSTLTTNLDALSDTALEKAVRQIKGATLQKNIGQSVRSNNSFRRAMSSARAIGNNTNLVRNNFADLTTTDYLNFNGLDQNAFTIIDKNNFTFKDLAAIYKNKNLLSFGSYGNEMYLRTFGGATEQDKVGTDIGYSSTTAGFVFGSQSVLSHDLQAGWGLGFSTTGLDYDEGYGLNNTHSLHANFFADKDYGSYKTNLSFGSFLSKSNSTRNVTEGATQTLKSTNYDLGFDIKLDLVKTINLFGWEVSPLASITSSYVIQDDINESGGDLALDINTDNLFQIKPELGLSFDRNLGNTPGTNKKLSFSIFGSKEEKLDGSDSRATIRDTGDGYALIDSQKTDKFLTSGLSYISTNEINNSLLNFGAFLTQNEHGTMDSGLLSFNYQKKF